jgi:DNA-binding NtrC family response regulator
MPSPDRGRIAIVEDDPIMGESLVQWLTLEGYRAEWWKTGAEALQRLPAADPDIIVCDIRLPDMSGEDVFRRTAADRGRAPVLFITAYGEIDQAVRLIRAGAVDYITKPFAMEAFLDRLDHLAGRRFVVSAAEDGALGCSEAMRKVERVLRRVATIDSTVLLTGESGVGKEVAARFLHQISDRAAAPFVAVNCAAIPPDLIDSELFGHERGAFTGAHARHEGYAERARDGILFLDEMAELPLPVQAKLLRLVQERAFYRVGGERAVRFNARLLCATNADLARRVAEGRFRQDLLYRLDVIAVAIPPLRERRDDIVPLLRHYIRFFAESFDRTASAPTTLAEDTALAHDWPGNVRELRNRAERAVALADGAWITPRDLFPEALMDEDGSRPMATLAMAREATEKRHILAALERAGDDVAAAAALLGISRSTLFDKIRRLGLERGGRAGESGNPDRTESHFR